MQWASLVSLVLLVSVSAANLSAQAAPATVLTEGTQRFYPGASNAECYDLAGGVLTFETASPPGRTGEAAFLSVKNDTAKLALLWMLVPDGQIRAEYPIDAGRYCYTIAVTHRTQDTGDPNRPDRPDKQVWLRMTYTP